MDNNQFELIIDYDKNEDNPERIFLSLAKLVSEFSKFDDLFCSSLAFKVNNKLVLEKIEQGSIKTTFTQLLENIDDEALQNLDLKGIIGHLLVKGKYKMLDFLKEDSENSEINIKQLQTDLFQLSKITSENTLKSNNYIPPISIAKSLDGINLALSGLSKNDKIKYITKDCNIETRHNESFSLVYEKTQLIERDMITNNKTTIIIKKPDLLGDSQWELKYNGAYIKANLNDKEWLAKFQNREINIQPKDSIECDLKIQTKEITGTKTEIIYSVEKVYKVIPYNEATQLKMTDFFEQS